MRVLPTTTGYRAARFLWSRWGGHAREQTGAGIALEGGIPPTGKRPSA
jgi:hypothetical protein